MASKAFLTPGFAYGQRLFCPSRYYLQGPGNRLWHFLEIGAERYRAQQYQAWDRSLGAIVCYGR